jgi:TPR repeat protein
MYFFEYLHYRGTHKKPKTDKPKTELSPWKIKAIMLVGEGIVRLAGWLGIDPPEKVTEEQEEEYRQKDEAETAKLLENERRIVSQAEAIRTTGTDKEGGTYYPLYQSVSDIPRAKGVLYAQNDRYLDVCAPPSSLRGLITILSAVFAMFFLMVSVSSSIYEIHTIFFDESSGIFSSFISFILLLATIPFTILLYFIFKHFTRLEIFVQRRLIIRFDRIHRKVYLHRPGYLGGVMTQDWDKLIVPLEKGNIRDDIPDLPSIFDTMLSLMLFWYQHESSTGQTECAFMGQGGADDMSTLAPLWEFIRRFMEEGPQTLPREKTLGKIPWPWQSLIVTFSGFSFLRKIRLGALHIGTLLMLPAGLLMAFVHWFSLLLCWEPVFPPHIRKACGEPFTAVLKARCVDIVAWSMLAGVLWWAWPTPANVVLKVLPTFVFKQVAEDLEDAAAERGGPEALYKLGLKCIEGQGVAKNNKWAVEQNNKRAVKQLTKAAEQGYLPAHLKLGFMYLNGEGVEASSWRAKEWYSKAAEQGHAEAQYLLGEMVFNTNGVNVNYKEAEKWYLKAAEQGHMLAQYKLGEMYRKGTGAPWKRVGDINDVKPDDEKAAKWYRKAAEQGHADAQYRLGEMYIRWGFSGVPRDYEEGANWFLKAAEQGHKDADAVLWDYLITAEAPENEPERSEWIDKYREGTLPKSGPEREALLNKIRAVVQERIAAKKNTKKPE